MSLLHCLRDPQSPLRHWFAQHLNERAVRRFIRECNDQLARHEPLVVADIEPSLIGIAVDYAFRWCGKVGHRWSQARRVVSNSARTIRSVVGLWCSVSR